MEGSMELINQKVGIVCCSNGQRKSYREKINELQGVLSDIGLKPVFSDYIYEKEGVFSGTAAQRADALMKLFCDREIKEIFDISGGDIANGILPYLNYQQIKTSDGRLWGYSDVTAILNAIYAKTGKQSVLYQIRNLIYDNREQQLLDFENMVINHGNDLLQLSYEFVQGSAMQGVVVGGNIRCFLKLAGTEYMPDLDKKILLLESFHGKTAQIETYLCQLQQLGAFKKAAGILLGTFTQMEEEACNPDVVTLVKRAVGNHLPIAMTKDIGHGTNAKAIIIGTEMLFEKRIENRI